MIRRFRFIHLLFFIAAITVFTSCGDIRHKGQVIVHDGKYVYRGGMVDGKRQGYGVLMLGDSVVYAGQWSAGKRQGIGVTADSLGHEIIATWQDDYVISGRRVDSTGIYMGQLTPEGVPQGHGSFVTSTDFYDGYWKNGSRQGFGFSSSAGKFRLGEWASDRYLGERLTYTSHRVYGIDISRFQHDVGRRHYPIDWAAARVTHLGSLSRKRIHGKVNYPISFCFIKSTEGTTLRNRYFLSDYRSAKKHGIRCGAYHFLTTRSSGQLQARFFLRHTVFQNGDFPPVLDVEPSHKQIIAMGGKEALFNAIRSWCRTVEANVGARPILYVSQSFVNRYLPSAPDLMRNYDFWIARYGEYKPDIHLVFWQLCPDGRVAGIRPAVDINVFNGYSEQFALYKQKKLIKRR
jgi:lysozyme